VLVVEQSAWAVGVAARAGEEKYGSKWFVSVFS
jgi:hypothetical protein